MDPNWKIDYHPGAHGNFLDLLLVLSSRPANIDLSQPLFDHNGACHMKYQKRYHPGYPNLFGVDHYSLPDQNAAWQLCPDDRVVEIHVPDLYRMIVVVNAHLRAGKCSIDIDDPEISTLAKYQHKTNVRHVTAWLIDQFGHQENYPRYALRTAYFKMYHDDLNRFQHRGQKKIFPHDSFFDFDHLCQELALTCDFFDLPFVLHAQTKQIWNQFIELNQGWHRYLRCQRMLEEIAQGQPTDLGQIGVAEEAWICYCLFRDRPDQLDLIRHWPESVLARR